MNKNFVRQQQILKHLGYYHDTIDGIWGPRTIKAKQDYENSGKFGPGLPNSGLPFEPQVPLPRGLFVDNLGLLAIRGVAITELEPPASMAEIDRQAATYKASVLNAGPVRSALVNLEATPILTPAPLPVPPTAKLPQREYHEVDLTVDVADLLTP